MNTRILTLSILALACWSCTDPASSGEMLIGRTARALNSVGTYNVLSFGADTSGNCYPSGSMSLVPCTDTVNMKGSLCSPTDNAIHGAINKAVADLNNAAGGAANNTATIYFPAGQYCAAQPILNYPLTSGNLVEWAGLIFRGDPGGVSHILSKGNTAVTAPQVKPVSCTTDADCPSGVVCFKGTCAPGWDQEHQPLLRVLSLGHASPTPTFQHTFEMDDLIFDDIDLRCRQLAYPGDAGGTSLVQIAGFDSVTLNNVTVNGNGPKALPPVSYAPTGDLCDGLALTNIYGGTLNNVNTYGARKAGLYLVGCSNMIVTNSVYNNSMSGSFASAGVQISDCQNLLLQGVTASNNGGYGIYLNTQGSDHNLDHSDVTCSTDADCQDPGTFYCSSGICIVKTTNITLSSCVLSNNGRQRWIGVDGGCPGGCLSSGTSLNGTGLFIAGVAARTSAQSSQPDQITLVNLTSTHNGGSGIVLSAGTNITFRGATITQNLEGGLIIQPAATTTTTVPWYNPSLDGVTVSGGTIQNNPDPTTFPPLPSFWATTWPGGYTPAVGLLLQGDGHFGTVELKSDAVGGPLSVGGNPPLISAPQNTLYESWFQNTLKLTNLTMPVLLGNPSPRPWIDMISETTPGNVTAPYYGLYSLTESPSRSRAISPEGVLYAPIYSTYTHGSVRWWKSSNGPSNQGWLPQGCASPSSMQAYVPGMAGCGGKVTWDQRNSLCGTGCSACTSGQYQQYVLSSGKPVPQPAADYWTNDNLGYFGNGPGACMASASGLSCGTNTPMRLCVPGTSSDSYGNVCNWYDCGFNAETPSAQDAYYGGCFGDTTAGTLCCCGL